MMKTKDLENLVKPYSSQGVSIRWVDDSTALAVFSTPALGISLSLHYLLIGNWRFHCLCSYFIPQGQHFPF
jgi:hypothetical protein